MGISTKIRMLQVAIASILLEQVFQINRIRNIVTPSVDFSNTQIGYITVKSTWETEINTDVDQINDLVVRVVLPFTLGSPLEVKWSKIKNPCDKVPKKIKTTGALITGDVASSQAFVLKDANFTRKGMYYMEMKMPSPTPPNGFLDPIQLSIISTKNSKDFITYAYHNAFANLFISPNAGTSLVASTAPSAGVANVNVITRIFESLIDITVNAIGGQRLLLKLDNHVFAHDAAQTCEVIDVTGYFVPASGDYSCEFEDDEYSGVFFSLKDATEFANGAQIRIMLKVQNPSLPATSSLRVALLPKYGPEVLQFITLGSAFTASAIDQETDYPKLYYGPGLLTSSTNFPKLGLYTATTVPNAIIFNSLMVSFKLKYDIPEPTSEYTVELVIGGGNTKTSIPANMVYENLVKATTKERIKITVDPTSHNILISGIGALSSLSTYSIGFKMAVEGGETFNWVAATGFCSIIIKDSGGLTVVNQKAPVGVATEAKSIVTNTQPSGVNMPTIFHSVPSTALAADYTGITATNYGLRKANTQNLIIQGNFQGPGAVATKSWIEIITNKKVLPTSTAAYTTANVAANCVARTNTGVDNIANVHNCQYEMTNKGTTGEEYTRFRIGAKVAAFWSPAAGTQYYWGLSKINIDYQNSLFVNDQDAAILDAYINYYASTASDDVTTAFGTPTTQYLDNMLVLSPTLMGDIKFDFPNYLRSNTGGNVLDGTTIPGFVRVSGVFDGINTIAVQKMLIFFNDFEPLYLDADQYEIGCSNSDIFLVRCYHQKGLVGGSRACGAGTCTNPLYRERIEVHFTTNTISLANSVHIQLLIPIKFPTGPPATNINLSIGVATIHSGGYNDYNQLIHFRSMPSITPPGSLTTLAAALNTPANVNSAASTKPRVVIVDTAVRGRLGDYFDSKMDMDCLETTYPECRITATGEYYSTTICGEWNFMEGGKLEVDNTQETFPTEPAYRKCVQNLRYLVAGKNKFCMWCAIWQSGAVEDARVIRGFKNPNYQDDKWPAGTYGALSSRNTYFGLFRITNMADQTAPAFVPNVLKNFDLEPTTWFKGFKSMKIQISFTISNPIQAGGRILVKSNTVFPITFSENPNTACIIYLKDGTKWACTATKAGVTVTITSAAVIPKGDLVIKIFGVIVDTVIADSQASFQVTTTTSLGSTSQFYLDQSNLEAFVAKFEAHPSGTINRLKINNIQYGNDDKISVSTLNITMLIGNSKQLYPNDRLYINLGTAGYATGTKPVWCYPVNAADMILTEFQTCVTTDLQTDFYLGSENETKASLVFVILENYFTPSAAGTADSWIKVFDGAVFNDAQTLLTPFTLPNFKTIPSLAQFTITKTSNHLGTRATYKMTFRTTAETIRYKTSLDITFPRNFYPSMGENIHSCAIEDGANLIEIFCLSSGKRILRISGFPKDIAPLTTFVIHFVSLNQGAIQGTAEVLYASLYNDLNELKESKQSTVVLPSTIASSGALYLRIYDLTFDNLFIRAQNTLSYKFVATGAIPSLSKILVFLEYYTYEYLILPSTLTTCTVLKGATNIAASCKRIGKKIEIETNAAMALNDIITVTIGGLVTPNYEACRMKKIVQYIEFGGAVKHISLSEYLNTKETDAVINPALIYLNFEGLSSTDFININRGIYNQLKVVRMDKKRFSDELDFTLLSDYNQQFKILNPLEIQKKDSYLGEESTILKFGCTNQALLSVYLLKVEKKERFVLNRFAPLPFLVIKNSSEKKRLPVPTKITIFRGYESLPMILKLRDLPPIEDLSLTVSIETYDNTNNLQLLTATSLTMNKDKELELISIKSKHEINSDPISNTNSKLLLEPVGDSPFEKTYIDLELKELVVDTSTRFAVIIQSTSLSSCIVNLDVHMPLTIYYYLVPKTLYANISSDWVISQIKKGNYGDGMVNYGMINVETSLKNYDICGGNLMADTDYVLKVFYRTFKVQNLASSGSAVAGTPATPGTLSFDPLYRHPFTSALGAQAGDQVIRLDQGDVAVNFRTQSNGARMGYIDLTFDTALSLNHKKEICCYYGQALSYPLENIWTDEGIRCDSRQLDLNITYFQGENFVAPAVRRRLLKQRQRYLQEVAAQNVVRVNILKNLRPSQDSQAFAALSTTIYGSTFDSAMTTQYSLPTFTSKSPLLEASISEAEIDSFANVTVLDDRSSVLLNRIKLKNAGYVHSILVENLIGLDAYVTYQDIRMGKHPKTPETPLIGRHTKFFSTVNEEYSYLVKGLKVDKAYVLYYYGSISLPNLLPRVTKIYKTEFVIKGQFRNTKSAKILEIGKWMVVMLGWIIMTFNQLESGQLRLYFLGWESSFLKYFYV